MECRIPEDVTGIDARIRSFLSDRGSSAVTGIRREGRESTVRRVVDTAEEMGLSVSLYPDISGGTDIIIVPDWSGTGSLLDDLRGRYPDADILFGQDLCHQVPAVVRLKTEKVFSIQ